MVENQKSNFTKRVIVHILLIVLITLLIVIYALFDPENSPYFPVCPFKKYTGFLCPGCGSQRAVHSLFQLNFIKAFQENALLVIALPYLIIGSIFDFIRNPDKKILKWRKLLFGKRAIYIILVIILAFWILRNMNFTGLLY